MKTTLDMLKMRLFLLEKLRDQMDEDILHVWFAWQWAKYRHSSNTQAEAERRA
jgi:hypothetical protein